MAEMNLNPTHERILEALDDGRELSARNIQTMTKLHASNVYPLLNELINGGYVCFSLKRRAGGPGRRMIKWYRLTSHARETLNVSREIKDAINLMTHPHEMEG